MNIIIPLFGILAILGISYLFSNNRSIINKRLVINGILLQFAIGFFILKTSAGKALFLYIAKGITTILEISKEGGKFVFGILANQEVLSSKLSGEGSFIFAVQIVPTIILICSLVSLLYYYGILQSIIKFFANIFNKALGVSGAEALANCSVAFVGQVESAIIIQPFLSKLTKSEILTIMTGGMACISGSLMAIYAGLGVKAEYLLAASCMAIPGSFVISKIFYPEDKIPCTKNETEINYKAKETNVVEAILDGAYSGAKISVGVIAMLIAFVSLVALTDKILMLINDSLSLKYLLGQIFTPLIYLIGVPKEDVTLVSQLFGTKIALNEFIAYLDLSQLITDGKLTEKGAIIASFILCGFANFGSIAIQIGGLSQMAPDRKSDFAELGFKAMICGAFVSLISGCIVGIIN